MDDCGENGANSHPPYHESEMRLNVNISYVAIQLHESPIFGICLNCFHSLDGGANLHSTWKKSMEMDYNAHALRLSHSAITFHNFYYINTASYAMQSRPTCLRFQSVFVYVLINEQLYIPDVLSVAIIFSINSSSASSVKLITCYLRRSWRHSLTTSHCRFTVIPIVSV